MERSLPDMILETQTALGQNDPRRVLELFKGLHPAEIAQVLEGLSTPDKRSAFSAMDAATASEVIVELSEFSRDLILEDIGTGRVAAIIDDLPSDDATDIIAELPLDQAKEVLSRIDLEDSLEVRTLLRYDEETAGGIMQLEMVAVRSDHTVAEVIEEIRAKREEVENLSNVFVVGAGDRLLGFLSLSTLLLADPDESVRPLMEECPLVVKANEDQELVAHQFRRYDVISAPVVDEAGRLIGRITVDDVMDVMEEEASEDFMRLAGSSETETVYSDKVWRICRMRLPWLIVNLVASFLSGSLLWQFRVTLEEAIFLAPFVPVIMAMGGNVGVQSSTIVVRGFAVGWVSPANLLKVLFRELRVAAMLGLICGGLTGVAAAIWHHNWLLGFVVGVPMGLSMLTATTIGSMAPAIFHKFKIDPAVASGPFVTTMNDITAIFIYFTIATMFLRVLQ